MSNSVPPIPEGYHSITPYLTIRDAAKAIDFYKSAFGAVEICRMAEASGKIGHAELRIGNSHFMVSDEYPDWGALGPQSVGGTSTSLMVYTEDPDAVFNEAIRQGAEALMPMSDQFYGDRCGKLLDPFGHKWMFAKRIEIVPEPELAKRANEQFGMSYTKA